MSNLAKRIISASVLLPPLIALILWGPPSLFGLLMVLLAAVAGYEFASITIGGSFPGKRIVVALFAALLCASIASLGLGPDFDELGLSGVFSYLSVSPFAALVALVPASVLAFMFSGAEPSRAFPAASLASTGAFYAGGLFGVISLVRSLPDDGRWWVLLLAAGTFLGDTAAYAFGRLLGRRKLAPAISPNKTWAGAVGGLCGTMTAVLVARLTVLPQLAWYDIALLGVPLSVFCQVGDLAESFLKRAFGVKDSGSIIPGHGGILDRCDALMFGAPVVLFFSFLR